MKDVHIAVGVLAIALNGVAGAVRRLVLVAGAPSRVVLAACCAPARR